MEIINSSGLAIGYINGRVNYPGHSLTLIVKGTFDLRHGGPATLSEQQLYPTGDEYYPDDEAQESLRYESDFAYFKPAADLLLVGKCHTPNCIPKSSCKVTFQVGGNQASLAVFGDRHWQTFPLAASTPRPFTVQELRYENSFGGRNYSDNPIGMGHHDPSNSKKDSLRPLPNIENIGQLIRSPDSCPKPAGFGPLDKRWRHRQSRIGTFEDNWLKERWPWFPKDFNWEYYNSAPPELQLKGYLKGDEPLLFENLHPVIGRYRSQLPGIRVRCFLDRIDSTEAGRQQLNEVKMNLDTLWVDMDGEQLILVWRGVTQVVSEDLEDLGHLYIVSEPVDAPPQSLEHHHARFQETLDALDSEFEEESPDQENEDSAEDLEQSDLMIAKAQETMRREFETAGLNVDRPATPRDAADQDAENALLAELGIDPSELLPEKRIDRKEVVRRVANGASLADEDLSRLDLSGLDLTGADFSRAILLGTNFSGSVLNEAVLVEAQLEKSTLADASLGKADCRDADFTGADLKKARLVEAILDHAIFEQAILIETDCSSCRCADSSFSGADLSGATLTNGLFDGSDFSKSLLDRADFSGASLKEASLEGARGERLVMRGCDLTELRASEGCCFPRSDFSGSSGPDSTWERAELSEADFSCADFPGADFSSATLSRANFRSADLKQARFTKADLNVARMVTANLFEAGFEKADLTGTDFSGSNLYGAEFLDALLKNTNLRSANLKMTKLARKQG